MLLKIERENQKEVKSLGRGKIFVGIVEYNTREAKCDSVYKKIAIEPSFVRTHHDNKAFILRCMLKINKRCNNILETICEDCFESSLNEILDIFKLKKLGNITFPIISKEEENEVKFFIKITKLDEDKFIIDFLNKSLKSVNTVVFSIKEIELNEENEEYFELTKEELLLRLLF